MYFVKIKINSPLFFILIFFFFLGKIYSQSITRKDSLYIEDLCKKAKDSIFENPSAALELTDKIIDFSKNNNYSIGLIRGYNVLGSIYQRKAEYQKALSYFNLAIDIARKKKHTKDLSMVLYNLSGLYSNISNYEKSFSASLEALNLKLLIHDSEGVARCYRQISENFFTKGDLNKAIIYSNKAVLMQRALGKPKSLLKTLSSRAVILIEQKKIKNALADLIEAKHISDSIQDESNLSALYLHLGLCYDNLQKKDSAIIYYDKSLRESNSTNNNLLKTVCYNNLGELYLKEKKFDLAEKNLLLGLEVAKMIHSNLDIKFIEGNLSQLYFSKGEYKKAFDHKENFEAYSDSVLNEQKMKTIEELSLKFETKEIAKENELLQAEVKLEELKVTRRNILIYSVLIVVLLSSIILFLFIRKRQVKSNNKNNELKQKLLLSQMNPHFIFNSVDNIQSLIHNNQNKEAINYLTKFSKLTRQILENSTENYITLEEELIMLDNYLSIQQLLYNNSFEFTIYVEPVIEAGNLLIPPMLSQPFVENAIKHGLKNKTVGGLINVRFFMQDNLLFFEVKDNGLGLENKNEQTQHKSVATQIVSERLNSQKTKKQIEILVENIYENKSVAGVRTLFEIPYIYDN